MLIGRQPFRTGMYGHLPVKLPSSSTGLPLREITMPEALKEVGYTTGMVGKWHLGKSSGRPHYCYIFVM